MSSGKGKVLVIRGGALGDFILTLPVFRALRTTFPEIHLEVLGYPKLVELARLGGLVDRSERIEGVALASFFARGGELDESMQEYFSQFALIISYLYDPDGIFQSNVARCSSAQFVVGPHRPVESQPIHATEVFLKPLESLAIFGPDPEPRIPLEGLEFPETGRARLALHPGSGSPSKNWAMENWAGLVSYLVSETDWDFTVVGGEVEGEQVQRLADLIPMDRREVLYCRPLAELALKLTRADLFLGHDSGISHLAAAVGLPLVVLWGSTVEEIWCPRAPRVEVLKHPDGLSSLSKEWVIDTLLRQMTSRHPAAEDA